MGFFRNRITTVLVKAKIIFSGKEILSSTYSLQLVLLPPTVPQLPTVPQMTLTMATTSPEIPITETRMLALSKIKSKCLVKYVSERNGIVVLLQPAISIL